jgi:hypothetical protein
MRREKELMRDEIDRRLNWFEIMENRSFNKSIRGF